MAGFRLLHNVLLPPVPLGDPCHAKKVCHPLVICRLQAAHRNVDLQCRAVKSNDYRVEESKTYLDEEFETNKPPGPRRSFDRRVLRKAETAPEGPDLQSMNHFAMEVFDNDLITEFYTKVLGFTQVNRPRFPFAGSWLKGAGVFIHLIQADPTVPRTTDDWKAAYDADEPEPWYIRRGHHHAFAVANLDKMEARLQHFGIEYAKFIVPDTSAAQIFLYDPEGNGIELGAAYEEIAESLKKKGLYSP